MSETVMLAPERIPDVTVIVRAADAGPALDACVRSVLEQSIGLDRIEVVAIDDGSTDGSGQLLEQYAARHPQTVRPFRVAASGSAAYARNCGIQEARGRYLIFLEGTDRLGPEALRRMVSSADRNESDVVLGKLGSDGGQSVATSMFGRNAASADLFTSKVYWSLTPEKLYRTDLLRRRGLFFPTDVRFGDDQPFTAAAYLAADAISVVADHVCYYKGQAAASRKPAVTPEERVALGARMMQLVAGAVPEGPGRDRLLSRHLEAEVGKATGTFLRRVKDPEQRQRTMRLAREVLLRFLTPGAAADLAAPLRVRFALIAAERYAEAEEVAAFELDKKPAKKVVEGGRVYTGYPYFRDPSVGVPDAAYDITDTMSVTHCLTKVKWSGSTCHLAGFAFFEQLSTRERNTEVVLRERRSGEEERFRVTSVNSPELVNAKGRPRSMGGFTSRINLRQTGSGWPIRPGLWDVFLSVSFEGVSREVRIGGERSAEVDVTARRSIVITPDADAQGHELVVMPYYTDTGKLTFEVSARQPLGG